MRAILLALILIALAVVLIARRRGQTGLGIPAVVLAVLALGLSLTFAFRPSQPAYLSNLEPFHRSVGYMLGRTIQQQSPNATKLVVLQDRHEDSTIQRLTNQQAEGLEEGLGGTECELVYVNTRDLVGKITTLAEEPPGPGGASAGPTPYEKLKTVMEANPEAVTIVSFVGYPNYVRRLAKKDRKYRCYVWDVGIDETVKWNAELASKRVAARVGPNLRADMQTDLPKSISMEEVFGMRYELDTAP